MLTEEFDPLNDNFSDEIKRIFSLRCVFLSSSRESRILIEDNAQSSTSEEVTIRNFQSTKVSKHGFTSILNASNIVI